MRKIQPPNYTQVPNILFDVLMRDLTEAELRVFITLCRLTFGYHKENKKVTASYKTIQDISGLSLQGAINGVTGLVKRQIITKTKDYRNSWKINMAQMVSENIINEIDNVTNETINEVDKDYQPSRENIINEVDSLKENKEIIKEISTEFLNAVNAKTFRDVDETNYFIRVIEPYEKPLLCQVFGWMKSKHMTKRQALSALSTTLLHWEYKSDAKFEKAGRPLPEGI